MRQLVGRAVEHGMSALALTDTAGMYGAVPFYQAARDAGVKPILGVCLDGVVVLARDREGYAAVCRLVTAYHLEDGFVLADRLESDHVFVLSGDQHQLDQLCTRGIEPLVAVTNHGGDPGGSRRSRYRAERMHAFAVRRGLRPVAVNPVYFLDPAQHEVQRTLAAIRRNTTVENLAPGDCIFRARPPRDFG